MTPYMQWLPSITGTLLFHCFWIFLDNLRVVILCIDAENLIMFSKLKLSTTVHMGRWACVGAAHPIWWSENAPSQCLGFRLSVNFHTRSCRV